MKVVVVADTHIGARNDDPIYNEHMISSWKSMIDYCTANNIDTIIHAGDVFDRRKYSNHRTLHQWKTEVFDPLRARGIRIKAIVGNHDIAMKDSCAINSPSLLLSDYENIDVYNEPTQLVFDQTPIDMIPWICTDNITRVTEFVAASNSPIAIAHLELQGFVMHSNITCSHGIVDKQLFQRYDTVLTGHFHHRSHGGNIQYVGALYEMNWGDADDPRGFLVLDTATRKYTFVDNPIRLHRTIVYQKKMKAPVVDQNSFIRLLVEKRDKNFDAFVAGIELQQPAEIDIVDVVPEVMAEADEEGDEAIDVNDTIALVKNVVANEPTIDQDDAVHVISIIERLYRQAI